MDPNEVKGPKNKIQQGSIKILVGKTEDASFSIATMKWDGVPRVGIRWNNSGKKGIGYPVCYGRPQWFIIPKEVALAYAKQINDIKIIETIEATSSDPLK